MQPLHYRPGPPLDGFIEMLWLWEGCRRPHTLERILPDGSMQIILNLIDDHIPLYDRNTGQPCGGSRGVLLCGPRSEFSVIDTATQLSVFGFHFKPGGMLPFLRQPLDELHDREFGLDCLWGSLAGELRERVLSAPTAAGKFAAAENYLLQRAVRDFARHPAVDFALRQLSKSPGRPLASLADTVGLSSRRFIELFRHEVGMPPKVFARVRRFQCAVRTIGANRQTLDWADLAAGCGYYDQAHFIHDFRAFAGLTPSAYLAARTEHLNHVPLEP
ncbi:MAG: helix-turn-helix domain-containing protein [Bryobacteraceae bacterium]|jgi:AraC-like DNA-binding protein